MKGIIKLFGILLLLAGISLLIKPDIIIGWIENNMENTSLYITAIIVRLLIGVLLIVVAKESKYPRVIKILGYIFIIAATTLIFIGQEGFQHLIASLIPDIVPFAPISGLLSVAFGAFLFYAFSRNKLAEK